VLLGFAYLNCSSKDNWICRDGLLGENNGKCTVLSLTVNEPSPFVHAFINSRIKA
jgi:hypothetical protein